MSRKGCRRALLAVAVLFLSIVVSGPAAAYPDPDPNLAPLVSVKSSVDSGALPLAVDFDASATTDPNGDALTYHWDFTGDGVPDATGPTASWTFDTPGQHTPSVTVTDATGAEAVGNLTVTAGNSRPALAIESPEDGGWAEFGENLPFRVRATDAEDGQIDCTKILVTYQGGEVSPGPDCTGVLTPQAHDEYGPNAFHVLAASYTDSGGVAGVPPLTGSSDIVLHPREFAVGDYPRGTLVTIPRLNLVGIDHIAMEFATRQAGVDLTVRADSPAGPVVATFPDIPHADSASLDDRVYQWLAADVTDPGGVHDLYLVAAGPDGAQPELSVGRARFQTTPDATAALTPDRPNGQNGWYTTDVGLKVAPSGGTYWNRQYSTDAGATWVPADAPAVLSTEGSHELRYRAVDVAGRTSVPGAATVRIDRTAPVVEVVGSSHRRLAAPNLGPLANDAVSGLASVTATLGGVPLDPAKPVELWRFPAGTHELAVTATDAAGNSGTRAVPVEITTSLSELAPLVDRFRLNWFVSVVLRLQLAAAEQAYADGRIDEAVGWVSAFRTSLPLVGDQAARTILAGDATVVLDQLRAG